MSRIWTETGFIDNDPWVLADDGEESGRNSKNIQPLNAFLESAEVGKQAAGQGAVVLAPADDITSIAPYLDRLALIALTFPAFNDGRAFSQAALLRERHGFAGRIRAVGDVLIDQIPLMLRCGIDSFAVTNPVAIARLEEGRLNGIPLHYQPAPRQSAEAAPYSWRRRSRAA